MKKFKHAVIDFVTGKYISQLENMAITYTKEFIPRVFRQVLGEHEVLDVAKSLDQVEMLLHGLGRSYYADMMCWDSANEFKAKVYLIDLINLGMGQNVVSWSFYIK